MGEIQQQKGGRERLGSRLGFILLSAGCAIGMGNVWRFPYITGQYGGGAFVLLYILFLVIMGVPVMTMEFAMGRASQKSPICVYDGLQKPKQKWHIHGWASLIGLIVLMMFYTVVAGWMLYYFKAMAFGDFVGQSSEQIQGAFGQMLSDPWSMMLCMTIVIVVGFLVNSFGVQKGLERVTKVMMLALFGLMIVLVGHSLTLEGAGEGLKFYLIPDFGKMAEAGIFNVVAAAMLQALFTLSLGIGSMAIFGSYIGKDRALLGEAVNVAVLDTTVAIMAGLIIFPACFTYNGGETTGGPGLIFQVLPQIFTNMPLGRLWGSLFFVFMSFAALSTVLAVFEAILACVIEKFGWSRKKACIICGIGMFVLSLPCLFGYNLLSGIAPLGKDIQSWEDFLVSYVLLPLGSLVYVIFCTNKRYGWGFENFMEEANQGKGLKIRKWMKGYMQYVLPVIMLVVFVFGLNEFFAWW